ncbi:MAG: ATP-binding protein [Bacillota bacterium]|nr:ATP-binding protein [Bacillota bacterium]
MKKIVPGFIITLVILIGCIIPSLNDSHLVDYMPTTKVMGGWQYRNGDSPVDKKGNPVWLTDNNNVSWENFSIPGTPPERDANGEVWVRVKLPEGNYKDPSIYFLTYNQVFQVFMDNKLIYSFGSFDKESLKKSPGSFWHIIDLPDKYSGKYVYIRMHAVLLSNTGLVRSFEVGSRGNHITNIVKANLITIVLASMFVFVGISALFISFVKVREGSIFIYFSLSCISAGVWLISENSIKQMFFYAPQFWTYIKIISQYSIPVTFSLLVNNLLENRYSHILKTIAKVHLYILIISLMLDALTITPAICTLNVYYISFTISMIIVIVTIAKSYSYWNTEIRTFSAGFAILCSFGTFDIINWNFNPRHSDLFLTQWGVLVFLISLCFVIILHYIKAQDKVIVYSEELKSKEKVLIESKQQLEFFANISHELRTPLNIILSTIQLLNLYKEDGSIKVIGKDTSNYFKSMKQNCYRLIRLVNNLIDITKIDSGYLKPKLENQDIVMIVEDITQSVADYIKSRGISIIFDTDVEEQVIACDSEKIERIMLNLLSNAVKFSKPGASILVDVHGDKESVVISVKDTGIGIEEDKLNDIFERFVQVDKSFTRNHEGSGIGLSLVKSLVEMLGGYITVKSEYGKGSVFKVVLPSILTKETYKVSEPVEIDAVHVEKVNIEFSDIYS